MSRPKRKKFSSPTCFRISPLAPSRVPIVSAPFIENFMFPVPDASLPAVDICSERSAAGYPLSVLDVEIGKKTTFNLSGRVRVIVHHAATEVTSLMISFAMK